MAGKTSFYQTGTSYEEYEDAATHAQEAEDARDAAVASQVAAETAESNASSSASAASGSAAAASASATAAANSATAAGTSATNAASSASAASTSATNAASSATAASASATAAANSATAAGTSATNAATSATNAAASYNSFRGVYYGTATADPTLDPLGNAINAGDLYFNTTSSALKIYDGAAWQVYNPLSGAPSDVDYLVKTANGTLSAERVVTDTATVSADWATAGQAKFNVVDDSISNAKLRNSAALSVIGNGTNASADPSDLTAGTDGHVLRRSGTTLGFGTIVASIITGLASIATSGSASDLSTGTLPDARLPNPSSTTLGGVRSASAVSNQWINSISTSGVPALSQPAFSNLSGSVAASQMPAHTGDVTSPAGSVALTIASGVVTYAKMASSALGSAAEYLSNTASKLINVANVWSAAAEVGLTDGVTITPDMSTFINASVTLGGNRTLANPTNPKVGQAGCIRIIQDGTGSRTLSFGANWDWAGGTAPTLSTAAGAVDCLYYHVLTTSSVNGNLVKAIS